jgi:hypothetical protein
MTRPRARQRASNNCVRKGARSTPRAKAKKRGVKPGTPSWRRFNYTPELLADCRRRYQDTPETRASIARDYGCSARTIGRLAADQGWTKFPSQRVGLPGHVTLRREVEAMAQIPFVPAKAGTQGQAGKADGFSPGSPLSRGRTDNSLAATIAQAIAETQAHLGGVAAARATAKTTTDRQRIAHTLASITTTLRGLQAMHAETQPPQSGSANDDKHDDTYDDLPADLDDFRRDLARRIDAFVASRTEPRDADGGGGNTIV